VEDIAMVYIMNKIRSTSSVFGKFLTPPDTQGVTRKHLNQNNKSTLSYKLFRDLPNKLASITAFKIEKKS